MKDHLENTPGRASGTQDAPTPFASQLECAEAGESKKRAAAELDETDPDDAEEVIRRNLKLGSPQQGGVTPNPTAPPQ